MTEITLFYQEKKLVGIESRGHSGYSEKGSDIICAAVSALMQALVLGIMNVAKLDSVICNMNSKVPLIKIIWQKKFSDKVSLLTKTIVLSLKQIENENPGYIKINTEEKL